MMQELNLNASNHNYNSSAILGIYRRCYEENLKQAVKKPKAAAGFFSYKSWPRRKNKSHGREFMDFDNFKILIDSYRRKSISRKMFVRLWAEAQELNKKRDV